MGQPTKRDLRWLYVFVGFTLVYCVIAWPSLRKAWWYTDDFWALQQPTKRLLNIPASNGRLVQGAWMLTYLAERGQHGETWNRGLRLLQICFHTLAATVMVVLLCRVAESAAPVLAILPFLLWAYSGEAVLWRSAAVYPLGALLGMLGLLAIRARPRAWGWRVTAVCGGLVLVTLAPLTNQASAMAPVVVLALMIGVSCLRQPRLGLSRWALDGGLVLGALGVGVAVSLWVGRTGSRTGFSSDPARKWDFLLQLNEFVIWFPGQYPRLLAAAHGGLLLIVLFALAVRAGLCGRRWRTLTPLRALVLLAILVSLFVLPHAAAAVASESWGSLRLLYLGPLLLSGFWLVGFELVRNVRGGRVIACGLLGVIVVLNAACLRDYAADRVRLFRDDRRILDRTVEFAHAHGTKRVVALTHPHLRVTTWNAHHLRVNHLDSSYSNLQISWAARYFIRRYSDLEPIAGKAERAAAMELCNERMPPLDFDMFHMPEFDAVCLCPP